jgi:hypothetical protein
MRFASTASRSATSNAAESEPVIAIASSCDTWLPKTDSERRISWVDRLSCSTRTSRTRFRALGEWCTVAALITTLLVDLGRRQGTEADRVPAPPVPVHPRVTVPELDDADLVADGFSAIAREGAANVDVAVRIQKLLAVLAAQGNGAMSEEAGRQAGYAWQRSLLAMDLDHDRDVVGNVHRAFHHRPRPA